MTTAGRRRLRRHAGKARTLEEDLERLLRLPAEAREVAHAPGGGAAGRRHPARRRRRVHRQLQAAAIDPGTAPSTGWPSPATGRLPGQLPKVVVGDPLAAGIVAKPLYVFLQILQGSGDPIFGALGLIFAIGVALGIAKNDGVSALAATVGYLVMNGTHRRRRRGAGHQDRDGPGPADARHRRVRRHPRRHHRRRTCSTGSTGSSCRPTWASSPASGSSRSSPRSRAIALGVVLAFVWPPIGSFIENTANQVISANAPVAVFVYGLVERALLPFGLHHIWNAPFFYTINVGGWADCNGILTCFFRGHPESGILGGGFLDQDVRPVRRGAGDLAGGEAGEPRPHRFDHARGGADHLPHRHHRAAGVLVPVRRAAAVRGARLPLRLAFP